MASGKVKFFNIMKGYGFIEPTEGGKDVFVHISDLQETGLSFLNENQKVEYSLMEENGKTKATDIKILSQRVLLSVVLQSFSFTGNPSYKTDCFYSFKLCPPLMPFLYGAKVELISFFSLFCNITGGDDFKNL